MEIAFISPEVATEHLLVANTGGPHAPGAHTLSRRHTDTWPSLWNEHSLLSYVSPHSALVDLLQLSKQASDAQNNHSASQLKGGLYFIILSYHAVHILTPCDQTASEVLIQSEETKVSKMSGLKLALKRTSLRVIYDETGTNSRERRGSTDYNTQGWEDNETQVPHMRVITAGGKPKTGSRCRDNASKIESIKVWGTRPVLETLTSVVWDLMKIHCFILCKCSTVIT